MGPVSEKDARDPQWERRKTNDTGENKVGTFEEPVEGIIHLAQRGTEKCASGHSSRRKEGDGSRSVPQNVPEARCQKVKAGMVQGPMLRGGEGR